MLLRKESGIAKAELQIDAFLSVPKVAEILLLTLMNKKLNGDTSKTKKLIETAKSTLDKSSTKSKSIPKNFAKLSEEEQLNICRSCLLQTGKAAKIAIWFLKKSITLYDSVLPQEYTFKDAQALLNNNNAFSKLSKGQILNCARAVNVECNHELNTRQSQVYLATFGAYGVITSILDGFSTFALPDATDDISVVDSCRGFLKGIFSGITGVYLPSTDLIAIKKSANAHDVKLAIPHESKHYHQEMVMNGVSPLEANCQPEIVDMWRENSNYSYGIQPRELDANKYATDFNRRHFSVCRQLRSKKNRIKSTADVQKLLELMSKSAPPPKKLLYRNGWDENHTRHP